MAWSRGHEIFDAVAAPLLASADSGEMPDTKAILKALAVALEEEDWDSHGDSRFYSHPLVVEAMGELHPDWVD